MATDSFSRVTVTVLPVVAEDKHQNQQCLIAGNYGHTVNLEIYSEKTLITDKNLNQEMNIKLI